MLRPPAQSTLRPMIQGTQFVITLRTPLVTRHILWEADLLFVVHSAWPWTSVPTCRLDLRIRGNICTHLQVLLTGLRQWGFPRFSSFQSSTMYAAVFSHPRFPR